jgi:hypothetical protein
LVTFTRRITRPLLPPQQKPCVTGRRCCCRGSQSCLRAASNKSHRSNRKRGLWRRIITKCSRSSGALRAAARQKRTLERATL